MNSTKYSYQKKVIQLAKQIYNHKRNTMQDGVKLFDWRFAMIEAHRLIKENPTAYLVEFVKSTGETVKRVVSKSIDKFYQFKDSAKKTAKEGLNKVIDLCKVALDLPFLFASYYEDKATVLVT